jgi:hypothetical protein
MKAKAAALLSAGALTAGLLWLSQSDQVFCLEVVAETASTITLSWDPPEGARGYAFVRDGQVVSHTWDGTRSTVKFGKGGRVYRVNVLTVSASDDWPDP